MSELGGLDLVIISAGTGDMNENLEFNIEKQIIDTNVIGFTCVADWAFNYFVQQKSGHLAGITSVAGIRGMRWVPGYSASKAYQINYLEGLRLKALKLNVNITVTDIRAGFVETGKAGEEKRFWIATSQKASRQIFAAIRRKRQVVYITSRWQLVGLVLKWLPGVILKRL